MNESEKQAWQQIRTAGQGKFVWREGVLRRGVPFGLIMVAFHFFGLEMSEGARHDWSLWLIRTTYYVIGFGGLSGVGLLHKNEALFAGPTLGVSESRH